MRQGHLVFFTILLATAAHADVLETRDGRILEGTYLGGTRQAVRFEVGGAVEVHPRDEVLALTFVPNHPASPSTPQAPVNPPAAPAPARAKPAAAPAPAPTTTAAAPKAPAAAPPTPQPAAPTRARVPAGTRLQVRMIDSIDARLATVGDPFAATLENGLGLNGQTIVAPGSKVYGRVAELSETGPAASRLKLELTGLMLQGQLLDLVSGSHAPTPSPAAGDAAAAADANAAPALARTGIQAGTLLEFRLLQPFDLRIQ